MRCPAGPLSPRRRRDYTSRRARPSRLPPGRRRAEKRAGTGVAVALGLYLTEAPPSFISAPRRPGPRRACVAPSARRVPPAEGGAWRGAAPLHGPAFAWSDARFPRAGPLCQAAGPWLGPCLTPSEPCRNRRAWRCRRPWTGTGGPARARRGWLRMCGFAVAFDAWVVRTALSSVVAGLERAAGRTARCGGLPGSCGCGRERRHRERLVRSRKP